MKKAIILVPGFAKREYLSARDELITSLLHYTDGYRVCAVETDQDQLDDAVQLRVEDRSSDYAAEIDVFEAFWGDLVPDWSQESPWSRFKRGLWLIWYWAFGGVTRAIFRIEFPTRTVLAMIAAGVMLIVWYLTVISVLLQTLGSGDTPLPGWAEQVLQAAPWISRALEWVDGLQAVPLVLFVIGLFGLGTLERIANLASFIKSYLRDDLLGGDKIGIRAKARKRVLAMLDRIERKTTPYDEVHVLGQSLGGVIAVDALAEFGTALPHITLHTWGSALGLLVQQDRLIEQEIGKIYAAARPLNGWVDVVFKQDVLASPRPLPRKYSEGKRDWDRYDELFAATLQPRVPSGTGMSVSNLNNSYVRCEQAVTLLVCPSERLPKPASRPTTSETSA